MPVGTGMGASRSEDLWTPYKELQRVVEEAVSHPQEERARNLEEVLRNHKQNFMTLLTNPPKNAESRAELRKRAAEGVSVQRLGKKPLSRDLVDEAVIISDMFNLDEYLALDLLCTAQTQVPQYPGLTRGLVAVLLYYDGRKAIASALRALVQARAGVSFAVDSSEKVTAYVTRYTDELMEAGIIRKILDLVTSMDLSSELELLSSNRALGGARHQRQVADLYAGTRQTLADVAYFWAAQAGLPRVATFQLVRALKTAKQAAQVDGRGGVDGVTLALGMALIYALDLSILQRREDGEEVVQKLPLIAERDFIPALLLELRPGGAPWENPGLQGLAHLAFGLSIASLRMAPQNLHPINFQDEDDLLVDSAIHLRVFEYLHRTFLHNASFCAEEFYVRRVHSLITDLVVLMPLKVKQLRCRADETSRTVQVYAQEGLEPPSNLAHHYEHLLLTIAKLYESDPLNLTLAADYWCPADGLPASPYPYRSPPIQVSLFKFVRTSGELLPASLFVPYMKMLRSLSASPCTARHAFNMLRQAGRGTSVSWDHFFSSLNQYYSNLRQELPVASDTTTVFRHHNYPRGITPQEVTCLQAVLALLRTVAENDEYSRVALCDNPSWAPLAVLLGLVCCSISIPLKADLLLALAALARSPATAASLWHNLEASQILATVPSTSSYQPRGIQTELEELESRNEEFPLTRAMLHLLDVLTNVPVPRLLGVGTRPPGFDPYLRFVLHSVFAKFHTRSYKNPDEKWQVGDSCLRLFVKFVTQYEPRVEDLSGGRVEVQGGGSAQVQPHPGYHILVNLNSSSELLRLVLYLVDECCTRLDMHSCFPGKEHLEAVALSCLQLLEKALDTQQRFFALLAHSASPLLLTGLNKLMLGINPRSGQPDHLLNVAKYVTYNSWLPRHAQLGVQILLHVTSHPGTPAQLLGALTSTPATATEIRHGFVECLEGEGEEEGEEEGVRDQIKDGVLRLLQRCLGHPTPNLTHFLLGFDTGRDTRKTVFQQPGVLGAPRSCLHSLLALMDNSLGSVSVPAPRPARPRLLEAAYALLHALCANPRTSEPVLRFLRSSADFLARHVAHLPFGTRGDGISSCELDQMSWLVKMVAVELKVSASTRQHSHLSHLVTLLIRETVEETAGGDEPPAGGGRGDAVAMIHLSQYLSAPGAAPQMTRRQPPLLLRLLAGVDLAPGQVAERGWEFFEAGQIGRLMRTCEARGRLVDVRRLHEALVEELAAIQTSFTAAHRQAILAEIQEVMVYALQLNTLRTRTASTVRFTDSWRQLTEVLFAMTPADVLPAELRQQALIDTLHLLLKKVVLVTPEVAGLASGAVLVLSVNLRHCYVQRQKEVKYKLRDDPAVDTSCGQAVVAQSNPAKLKVILAGLLEWILGAGVSSQMLRANLYGSLLNFLQIACLGGSEKYNDQSDEGGSYVSRLDSSWYRCTVEDASSQRTACLEVITMFGDGLVDSLCHDCTSGADIGKMLALSCLDMLIELDPHTNWVTFVSSRGYLKHLIDSLLDSDESLTQMLEAVPDSLRPLYVYESKMALLCRMAATKTGAELLLEQNGLACLSSMTVYDRHPDIKPTFTGMEMDFVPSVGQRYMQVLFPALDLCDAVLTSLGTENQSCSSQIMYFLLSHSEMVTQVLRSGSPFLQVGYLKELARLTGVIARASNLDMCNVSTLTDSSQAMEGKSHLLRIQKQMLALLPRFVLSDTVLRDLSGSAVATSAATSDNTTQRAAQQGQEAVLRFFQVACHLVLYARNIVSSLGSDHRATSVVLRAGLGDMQAAERSGRDVGVGGDGATPSVGAVVQQLVQCVSHYHRETTTLDLLNRKHSTVLNMNSQELAEFLPEGADSRLPIAECRAAAAERVEALLGQKRLELQHCCYLVENCCYLVWCHLDYYMLRAVPRSNFSPPDHARDGYMTSISESSWQVTTEEISQMKLGLVSIFSDTFSKQLLDTKQDESAMDRGFVEALLRRIKRLIQFVPVK